MVVLKTNNLPFLGGSGGGGESVEEVGMLLVAVVGGEPKLASSSAADIVVAGRTVGMTKDGSCQGMTLVDHLSLTQQHIILRYTLHRSFVTRQSLAIQVNSVTFITVMAGFSLSTTYKALNV